MQSGTARNKTAGSFALEHQIGFLLRLAFQHHTAVFKAHMVADLTQTQFATLTKLHKVGAVSQRALGRLLELDSATINGVVERLRSRGLVNASRDRTDGRRQLLTLSPEGLKLIVEAEMIGEDISAKTLTNLTLPERQRLLYLLRKMMRHGEGKVL